MDGKSIRLGLVNGVVLDVFLIYNKEMNCVLEGVATFALSKQFCEIQCWHELRWWLEALALHTSRK